MAVAYGMRKVKSLKEPETTSPTVKKKKTKDIHKPTPIYR